MQILTGRPDFITQQTSYSKFEVGDVMNDKGEKLEGFYKIKDANSDDYRIMSRHGKILKKHSKNQYVLKIHGVTHKVGTKK